MSDTSQGTRTVPDDMSNRSRPDSEAETVAHLLNVGGLKPADRYALADVLDKHSVEWNWVGRDRLWVAEDDLDVAREVVETLFELIDEAKDDGALTDAIRSQRLRGWWSGLSSKQRTIIALCIIVGSLAVVRVAHERSTTLSTHASVKGRSSWVGHWSDRLNNRFAMLLEVEVQGDGSVAGSYQERQSNGLQANDQAGVVSGVLQGTNLTIQFQANSCPSPGAPTMGSLTTNSLTIRLSGQQIPFTLGTLADYAVLTSNMNGNVVSLHC